MLERVPATAESAAQFFLRSTDRPHVYRSSRVLDSRFWRNGGEGLSCAAWWPQYLQEIRQIPYSSQNTKSDNKVILDKRASAQHKGQPCGRNETKSARMYTVSAVKDDQASIARMNMNRQRKQAMVQKLRALREGKAQPANTPLQADSAANREQEKSGLLDEDIKPILSPNRRSSRKNRSKAYSNMSDRGNTLPEQKSDEDQAQEIDESTDTAEDIETSESRVLTAATNVPNSFNSRSSYSTEGFINPYLDLGELFDKRQTQEAQLELLSQDSDHSTQDLHEIEAEEPMFSMQKSYINEVYHRKPTPKVKEAVEVKQMPDTDNANEIEFIDYLGLTDKIRDDSHDDPIPEQSRRALYERRMQELRGIHSSQQSLTETQFQTAWELFLSFESQQDVAPLIVEIFSRSSSDRQLARAREAFRLIPEDNRDISLYRTVIKVEVKRDQFESAIRLAMQATRLGYKLLPELLASFVSDLYWSAAGELLHCNKTAYIDASAAKTQGSGSHASLLPESELLASCEAMPGLDIKLIDLVRRLEQNDATLYEHRNLLLDLRKTFANICATSPAVIGAISSSNLLTLFDLQRKAFGDHSLHDKALRTIHKLENSAEKVELALMTYRNRRFTLPRRRVTRALLGILISLCNQAHYSLPVYDYIAEELRTHCDGVDRRAYQRFATACSRQGNVVATQKVIAEYERDHGTPPVEVLSTLIYANAVHGDVDGASIALHNLETVYAVAPNVYCFNMLLLAISRSSQARWLRGLVVLTQMRRSEVAGDTHTYGTLLAICQRIRNLPKALEVMKVAREHNVQISMPMLTTLVETYLAKNQISAARRFAMASAQSQPPEVSTRLWNVLIRHFAGKGRFKEVVRIRAIMRSLAIKPDALTYSPIVLQLTLRGQTMEAIELLREMQERHKLAVTPFLYSLILHGAVRERNVDLAHIIFTRFEQQYAALPPSARQAMLNLVSQNDLRGQRTSSIYTTKVTGLLQDPDDQMSAVSAFDGPSAKPLQAAQIVAKNFAAVIRILLKQGSITRAKELVQHFENEKPSASLVEWPQEYLLAKMDVALEDGAHDEVEEIFRDLYDPKRFKRHDVLENVIPIYAANTMTSTSLSKPLNKFMESKARAGMQRELPRFIHSAFEINFKLTSHNYNKYVQCLCRSDDAATRLHAFKIAEKVLLNRAQSWNLLRRGRFRRKVIKWVYQRQNFRSIRPVLHKKITHFTTDRGESRRLSPARPIPTYTTMVYLAGVLERAAERARSGDDGELGAIRQHATKLKHFLERMPRLRDSKQGTILRGWNPSPEPQPRPRSEEALRAKASVDTVRSRDANVGDLLPAEVDILQQLLDRPSTAVLAPKPKDTSQSANKLIEKIRVAEILTGQIQRSAIVLARQSRFETDLERDARIKTEEREKLAQLDSMLSQVRAGGLYSSLPEGVVTTVGIPKDVLLEKSDYADVRQSMPYSPLPQSTSESANSEPVASDDFVVEHEDKSEDEMRGSHATGSLSLQHTRTYLPNARKSNKPLARVYTRSPRDVFTIKSNESVENQVIRLQKRRKHFSELGARPRRRALDYVQLRMVRAQRAMKQRAEVDEGLERPFADGLIRLSSIEPRTSAMKRITHSTIAKRRRASWLEFEADLRAGYLSSTERPSYESKYRIFRRIYGQATLRFVPDLGRMNNRSMLIKLGILRELRRPKLMSKFDQRKYMRLNLEGDKVIEQPKTKKIVRKTKNLSEIKEPVQTRTVNFKFRSKRLQQRIRVKQALARQAEVRKQRIIGIVGAEEYERRLAERRQPAWVPYR